MMRNCIPLGMFMTQIGPDVGQLEYSPVASSDMVYLVLNIHQLHIGCKVTII